MKKMSTNHDDVPFIFCYDNRKVLIVLDVTTLQRGSEVAGKIGDPKALPEAGGDKSQRNGVASAPQQNQMSMHLAQLL